MAKKGYLILENGKVFEGISFGSQKDIYGEVVFNTGMVGYPEGFTDPSYYGQVLVLTYPLIGNYGVPRTKKTKYLQENLESDRIHIRGLIVSSYEKENTHWQSVKTLGQWLQDENVPALFDVDTRTLTQIIRDYGVMKGCITFQKPLMSKKIPFIDINKDNLIQIVSTKKPFIYGSGKTRILFFDCGEKENQLKLLLKYDTLVIRVPWNYDPFDSKNTFEFDAIMISNGPGDPKMAKKTIHTLKIAMERKIPIFGICLGNQILALAAGADTYKLKYGHRGQNQPVRDELTRHCYITTQNHGFAVNTSTLPKNWIPWFTNLNDGTNEGIQHNKLPFFSAQFHPEDMPGPTDTRFLFDYFLKRVNEWKKRK